jgi:uncharacterized membrane protein YdjX (TVP38/TMEM64 family)
VTAGDQAPARRIPARTVALSVFAVASAAVGVIALAKGWIDPASLQRAAEDAGPLAWAVYVAAVALGEILWFPRSWGLVAGGALFGPVVGGLLSIVADTIGATLCYAIGRGGGRAWVASRLERRPRAKRVVDLLAKRRGMWTVAFLRVVPVAHYTVVSYAAGLAGVRFASYLAGNSIGILPGAFLYPFLGHAALRPTSPEFLVGVGVLVAALVVSVLVARRAVRRSGVGEE